MYWIVVISLFKGSVFIDVFHEQQVNCNSAMKESQDISTYYIQLLHSF